MALLPEFETALKEVVNAKRLSASKMNNLTEIALKSMEDDTQLVSILYRTHKSLQAPAKVSSLYVFDALARAARSQVVKQNLTGDINARKGNSATFLLKVEGVLEGLFQDMISAGTPESKEKAKKVLDIWSKGSTFPPAILTRLKVVMSETEKEKDTAIKVTSDPRSAAVIPPPAVAQIPNPIPPVPVLNPQATLLALLTQAATAAQSNPAQTNANTVSHTSQQFAALQQFAQAANFANAPPPMGPSGPVFSNSPTHSPSSYRDEAYGMNNQQGGRRFERGPGQEQGRNFDDRNGYRGGFRGRGRGDGRAWDDRERFRDAERSPPRRVRRSRSRSPPSRYVAGRRDRDIKPYSPPHRPSMSALPAKTPLPGQEIGPIPRAAPQPGKDEFGRDIRPASPSPEPPADIFGPPTQPSPPPPPPTAPPTAPVVRTQTVEPPPAALTSNHDQMSLTPSVDANTSSRAPDAAAIVSNKVPSQPGMENFSLATFDFTAPASWEALGKMWQVTHGYLPSTEQLMQFVMAGGVGAVATQQPQQQAADWTGSQNWGANQTMQPRRGGRGRGGFSRGRGFGGARDNQERGWHSDMGETDAIVLGGGDDDGMVVDAGQSDTGGGPGGRMQRVGEKWVFVRDPVANQS